MRKDNERNGWSDKKDELFIEAEKYLEDFLLFPESRELYLCKNIQGLLTDEEIEDNVSLLKEMDVNTYIEKAILPAESKSRKGGRAIIKKLGNKPVREETLGPLYSCEIELDFGNTYRRIGLIAQDRSSNNGVWMPQHHYKSVHKLREFAHYSIPVVTLIDTPGADANEEANSQNQAHSISQLIAEMANIDVPTIGIIIGNGYSGGAIPLATTNLIFSIRDGVFNTIQPRGLSAIARKYKLSWQECAKYVSVSAYELHKNGYIDGIIDFVPGEKGDTVENLRKAIVTGILWIEEYAKKFVLNNNLMLDHYHKSVQRFIEPSETLNSIQNVSDLSLAQTPTEQPNVFGLTYRYLRYLTLRKRIDSMSIQNYGRLAKQEIPRGDLLERIRMEQLKSFFSWLQDPDKIIYDDNLNRAWKNYVSKRDDLKNKKGWLSRHIFGDPQTNYIHARNDLLFNIGFFLYTRWKKNAPDNFTSLIKYASNYKESVYLFKTSDFFNTPKFIKMLKRRSNSIEKCLYDSFSYELKKLLSNDDNFLQKSNIIVEQLAFELNQIIQNRRLYNEKKNISPDISPQFLKKIKNTLNLKISVTLNRQLLERLFPSFIKRRVVGAEIKKRNLTILDIIWSKNFRNEFITECQNFMFFNSMYDKIVSNLILIAKEAHKTKNLAEHSVEKLLTGAIDETAKEFISCKIIDNETRGKAIEDQLKKQFTIWLNNFIHHSDCGKKLKLIEEWKKIVFPRISDTLFVIITFFFEKLLPEYYAARSSKKKYTGKVNPVHIGKKKNFWYRLSVAYNDLLIQDILIKEKRVNPVTPEKIISNFFEDFRNINGHIMTSDPVNFPGFRISIEESLSRGITPCGIITGIGKLKLSTLKIPVGVIISNIEFQAGAFDMASSEKVCKLLVTCVNEKLPVIGFISSSGMQTKEGAGALFSMPIVNDRFTRFIRENDLPILIFGFGDCTGGAQASFVTHPMVQTYYFSGTNMPFAGQIVVPSYLPSTSTLSNYLSLKPGSMQGLVKNPFSCDLDVKLREVDPYIPVPAETVEEIIVKTLSGVFKSKGEGLKEVEGKTDLSKYDLMRTVKKVLIHARGCTAVKLIPKAQDKGIKVVLIQSDPDMDSIAVDLLSENDQVVCIGGNTPDESYLNAPSVLKVAEHENVDSLHPGIGFLSENAQFAEICLNHGINFIGPSVYSMEIMGNKSNAINTALSLNVPVVPGSHGIITGSDKAAEIADKIGYPVILKAVHGGGGKGIKIVTNSSHIHSYFNTISAEAKSAFGNGDIYIEKYITTLRHIEIQILRDIHGNTRILGLRDCSVQRNNQKLIEESESKILPAELKQKAFDYTLRIADKISYLGAGTVEFIYDLDCNEIYFMEMNTRLQVEHPVTEMVSGVDIVGAQFDIAESKSIEKLTVKDEGYAMEVRINAEKAVIESDDSISFIPTPGKVTKCVIPEDDCIEVISTIGSGKTLSPFYDSMIIQVICHGQNREDTIDRLISFLSKILVEGICTNIPLIQRILRDPLFRKGDYDTTYLTRFLENIDKKSIVTEIESASGLSKRGDDISSLKIEGSEEIKVLSPSTGVYYSSPAPEDSDFVKVGDAVSVNDPLCLIEAMKLYTHFTLNMLNNTENTFFVPSKKYEITRINLISGDQVNEGDLLFVVKQCG